LACEFPNFKYQISNFKFQISLFTLLARFFRYKELYEVTKNSLRGVTETVAAREGELIAREEELVDLRWGGGGA